MIYLISEIVFVVLLCVLGTVNTTRQLQMLQQNSYFASRYLGWLHGQKSPKLIYNALCIITAFAGGIFLKDRTSLLSVIFGDGKRPEIIVYTVIGIFAACLLNSVIAAFFMALASAEKNRSSIKPLAVTARVKRMYIFIALLFATCGTLSLVLNGTVSYVFWFILILLVFTPCVTVLAALFALSPLERILSFYYVNDAKNILKASENLTVIGVTGSYGKTSTKFILKSILDEKFNVVATPGSYNTPLGVVRTVREQLRPSTDIFICEMGAKKVGDIKEICDIAKPSLGIITAVGPQHLDTFGSQENVAATKFELADAANEVFLNFDNDIIKQRAENYNHTSYGTGNDCDVHAESIQYSSLGASFNVICDDDCIPLMTRLLGRHNVLNITGAVAVAKRMGLSDEQIEYAVYRLKPTEHRLELKSFINDSLMIDDAYNANPEGCIEAVNVLSSFEGKKKIIVTPGLVELGEREYDCNYNLGLAAAEKCDIIILVGKERSVPLADAVNKTDFCKDNLHIVASFSEAMTLLSSLASADSVTLIENDLPDNYLK